MNKKKVFGFAAGIVTLGILSLGLWRIVNSDRPSAARSISSAKPILLFATSDFHGALDPQIVTTRSGQEIAIGGAETLLAVKAAYQTAIGDIPIVHVDAGDLFQGTLVADLTEGKSVIDFYKIWGVDAIAIGNHDFDFGPVGPKPVPTSNKDNPVGNLVQRIQQSAPTVWLAANLKDPSRLLQGSFKDFHILEKAGVKIGIIGLAGSDTPETTDRRNLGDLQFASLSDTVKKTAHRLRSDHQVHYVIVVAHTGSVCDDNSSQNTASLASCGTGGIIHLANQIPEGVVDAFVGGHTHKGIYKIIKGAKVLQSFSDGKYIGVTWLGSEPVKVHTGLVPICSHALFTEQGEPNCNSSQLSDAETLPIFSPAKGHALNLNQTDLTRRLTPYRQEAQQLAKEPLGVESPQIFTKDFNRENSLGNLMVDLLALHYPDFDAVLLNNGTLRQNLDKGNLIYNDIYRILPFQTLLAEVEVSREELLRMIRIGLVPLGEGLSWSGLQFESDRCAIDLHWLKDGPAAKGTFKILTTDFVASGGVGFSRIHFKSIKIRDDLPNLRESFVLALKGQNAALQDHRFLKRQHTTGVCPVAEI